MAGSCKVCWNNPTEQGEGVPDHTVINNKHVSNHSDSHLFTVIKSNGRGKQSHRCLLFTPL